MPECLDMARETIRGFVRCLQRHGESVPDDVGEFPFDMGDALEAMVYRVTVRLQEAAQVA